MKALTRSIRSSATLALGLVLTATTATGLDAQAIMGMVFDEEVGSPLTGAQIQVLSTSLEPLQVVISDPTGRFQFNVDSAGTYVVVATLAGYASSPPEVVELVGDDNINVMMGLRLIAPDAVEIIQRVAEGRAAYVFGKVEEKGGRPVEGAEVRLTGREGRWITNGNGRFVIREVDAGLVDLRVEHIGYAVQGAQIPIESGLGYEVNVRMDIEAIELEPIQVVTRSRFMAKRLEPVLARMDRATAGYFLGPDDFRRRGYGPVAQILQGLPSTQVRRGNGYSWEVVFRSAGGFSGTGLGGPGGCVPAIYVDGVRVARPGEPPSYWLNEATSEVDIIEVYPGPASLPPEYNDPGTFCAIGIWTKRGG